MFFKIIKGAQLDLFLLKCIIISTFTVEDQFYFKFISFLTMYGLFKI